MRTNETPEARHNYDALIVSLAAHGILAEFHRPGQLVLSGRIWITWQGTWFISTWTPAVYPVPVEADIVALCVACQKWPDGPFYTIPDQIATRFGLTRADDSDLPLWFAGDENES